MQNQMPVYPVWNYRSFMGHVSAVSLKQAKERARKLWPNRRLQLEAPINKPLSDRDRLESNRGVQAKAKLR
jgi:hypothetical protein